MCKFIMIETFIFRLFSLVIAEMYWYVLDILVLCSIAIAVCPSVLCMALI
jgi:hypothetical protein